MYLDILKYLDIFISIFHINLFISILFYPFYFNNFISSIINNFSKHFFHFYALVYTLEVISSKFSRNNFRMEFSILVHCACFLCITWRLFSVSVWYAPIFLGKIFEGHLRHTRFLAFFCSSLIKSFVSKSSNVTTSSSSGLIWERKKIIQNKKNPLNHSQYFQNPIYLATKICCEKKNPN